MRPGLRASTRASIVVAALLALASAAAAAVPPVPPNSWVRQPSPTQVTLPGFPGTFDARGWSHLVYDSLGQRMVLWDGYVDGTRPYSIYGNAIWLYDVLENRLILETVTNWVRQNGQTVPLPANTTNPTPYDRHSYSEVTVVPSLRRVYLWAGANNSVSTNYDGDLWVYDLGARSWREVKPTPRPYTMFEQAMVYDKAARKVVLFAGPDAAYRDGDRAWLFDPWTETWQDRPLSPVPSVRMGQSMVYDPVRRGTWLFGGGPWPGVSNELWFFDAVANSWQRITASGPWPASRKFCGFAYDSRNDVILLWGGVDGNDSGLGDTWVFFPATRTWQQLLPSNPPPAGTWYSNDLEYDPVNNVFVLKVGSDFYLYRYGASNDPNPPNATRDLLAR